MLNVGLFDGCFGHQRSATLGGDNSHYAPAHFRWTRDEHGAYSTFYTDMHLHKAHGALGLKVAWLIEPPSLSDTHYRQAVELEDMFDYILTFDTSFLERGEKWLYYPLGGSWIRPEVHGITPKTRMCSIIASEKTGAVGHRIRHEIVRQFRGRLAVMGRGYAPIGSKTAGLYDYMYSVVVESVALDAYFSEKLIDCFTLGTLPIYWGCPSVGDFFNTDGMLVFDSLDELDAILRYSLSRRDYEKRIPAMQDNLKRAVQYACAENWIYEHYPFLFRENNDQQ